MERKNQKEVFIKYEADSWFKRNIHVLEKYDSKNDNVINLLDKYKISPSKVLEIGCSIGYRLDAISEHYNDTTVYGIEPSLEAINYGKQRFPNVHFFNGTIDDLSCFSDNQFDLVIVGCVFYVVDRALLIRAMSEVDRVLKDRGNLVLIDFFTEATTRNKYHHIHDIEAYTYKCNYDQMFSSTTLYHLLDRTCYNHSNSEPEADIDFQEMYSISLLKKDLNASYK